MDQRKLIQHGLSSLTVALPSKWLKNRDLKKGDSIFINIEGNKLILSTEESIKFGEIEVQIDGLDRTSLLLYIQSLYRFGYDTIKVSFKEKKVRHFREGREISVASVIYDIVNRLIGAEIIEEKENTIIIRYLSKEKEEDFLIVLRRIFLLLEQTTEDMLKAVEENDSEKVERMEHKHDNIDKFVSYALRLLNKYGYPDVRKTTYYYHIIASMSKIMDTIKYSIRDIKNYDKKFTNDSILILKQINKSITMYYELFYKFDLKTVTALNENRDNIKLKIKQKINKIPLLELLYLTNIKQILEIILDLTDFRMGLEY